MIQPGSGAETGTDVGADEDPDEVQPEADSVRVSVSVSVRAPTVNARRLLISSATSVREDGQRSTLPSTSPV